MLHTCLGQGEGQLLPGRCIQRRGGRNLHQQVLHAQLGRRGSQLAGGAGHLGQRITVPERHRISEAGLPGGDIRSQLPGTVHTVGGAIVLLGAGGRGELDIFQQHLIKPGGVHLAIRSPIYCTVSAA